MELLLAALAGGFVVWLIARRNKPVATLQPGQAATKRGGPGFIGWLIIIGAVLYGASHLFDTGRTGTQATSTSGADPYDQTGCSASKRAVSAKLRSPGSAQWVSCRVTTSAGVQTVTLAVDSQNAMGGLIRSEWMTQVRNNNVESVAQLR